MTKNIVIVIVLIALFATFAPVKAQGFIPPDSPAYTPEQEMALYHVMLIFANTMQCNVNRPVPEWMTYYFTNFLATGDSSWLARAGWGMYWSGNGQQVWYYLDMVCIDAIYPQYEVMP